MGTRTVKRPHCVKPVESGLRRELKARRVRGRFELVDARIDGNGLAAEYADAGWAEIRDAAYSGAPTETSVVFLP